MRTIGIGLSSLNHSMQLSDDSNKSKLHRVKEYYSGIFVGIIALGILGTLKSHQIKVNSIDTITKSAFIHG